ncbi:hypothetical protein ACIBK9_49910 [Nonomuraea sp. NPDC050227]|uniref:hypothetical protein n=1 Tax=Nonomuraea sp. NPDC050227 TaxID=3364360 RepID=UPI00378E89FA
MALSLRNVTALLDQPLPRQVPGRGQGTEAAAILTGLREGLTSSSEQVAFFSAYLSATSLRLGGADLSHADARPQEVLLDGPAVEVFIGRAMRSMVIQWERNRRTNPSPSGSTGTSKLSSGTSVSRQIAAAHPRVLSVFAPPVAALGLPRDAAADISYEPFAEGCDSDGVEGWALWVMSKVTGGIAVGGFEFSGVWGTVLNKAAESGEISELMRLRGLAGAEVGGYIGSLLTVITAVDAIFKLRGDVVLEPREPLVRNKLVSEGHGQRGSLVVTVSMKFNHPEESVEIQRAMNCIAQGLSVVGNNSLFAATGSLENVRVEVAGARGFGDRLMTAGSFVLFGPEVRPKLQTDKQGQVHVPVQGRGQSRDVPDNARAVEKTASITVQAAPAAVTGGSLTKSLLDSVLCGAKPGLGCADAIADVAQSFTWSLGEFKFKVRDWAALRLRYSATLRQMFKETTHRPFDEVESVDYAGTLVVEGEAELAPLAPPFPGEPPQSRGNGSIQFVSADRTTTVVHTGRTIDTRELCTSTSKATLVSTNPGALTVEEINFAENSDRTMTPTSIQFGVGELSENYHGTYVVNAGPCPSGSPHDYTLPFFAGALNAIVIKRSSADWSGASVSDEGSTVTLAKTYTGREGVTVDETITLTGLPKRRN